MNTAERLRRRERPADRRRGGLFVDHPLRWGFIVTLGVLLALMLASALIALQGVVLSVFVAAFVALGLDPLIRWFQRRGMPRGAAIVTVILIFVAVVVGIVWLVVPPVVTQAAVFIKTMPAEIHHLVDSGWFERYDDSTNGVLSSVVEWVGGVLTDPDTWAAIGGGALAFGAALLDGISTSVFVVVLSIYFIATLDTTKRACYTLVAASHRARVESIAERIMLSVGKYLSGMVVLAFFNSVFSTILLSLVGVRYALFIGVLAFFITLIPLIGTVITTVIMTIVALFVSPVAGLIVLIAMLVYMQVEAYVLTPKVMGKAVQVPGTIVLISALAGGTLLGLLGALVAIPISAGILLIIREVVVPKQAHA